MDRDRQKENDLLAKIVKKDAKAFEALYKLLSQSVFHYLYRLLQNKERAEDVLAEVFSAVWRSAINFKGRSCVKTWIFGIARNLAYNELRKKQPQGCNLIHDTLKDKGSDKAVKGFENRQYIQKALSKVSEKHREILDLVFFHEATYADISELLNIPENTVKTRVYYAKAALKEAFIKMEI